MNKKRKRYFIGIPDRMNNSWYFGASGFSRKEALENFEIAKNNKNNQSFDDKYPIKNTYIEELFEEKGWEIIKVLEGWD